MRKNKRSNVSRAQNWGLNLDGEPIYRGLSSPARLSKTKKMAKQLKAQYDAHTSAMSRLEKARKKIKD